jgi:hypothetical protein
MRLGKWVANSGVGTRPADPTYRPPAVRITKSSEFMNSLSRGNTPFLDPKPKSISLLSYGLRVPFRFRARSRATSNRASFTSLLQASMPPLRVTNPAVRPRHSK